jgi:broad specificity phosphatase PhoE
MELILTRHGHICDEAEVPVIAGQKYDFPLVEAGGTKAEIFAKMLMEQKISPISILCSNLRRTKRYAEIIAETIGMPGTPMIDDRLIDLDYGDWTGLTEPEVALKYGEKVYSSWVKHGMWPEEGNWGENPQKVHERITTFCHDLTEFYDAEDTVVVVASNGLIKFFLGMIEGEFEKRSVTGKLRMDIGHISKLVYENGAWNVAYWNMNPQDMLPVPNPREAAQKAITNAAKTAMMLH